MIFCFIFLFFHFHIFSLRLSRCAGPCLHGQLVEFFCWNLESAASPPHWSGRFLSTGTFSMCQIDATSFANCEINFFCNISKALLPEFLIVEHRSQLLIYSFWLIINRRTGCSTSGRHSMLMEVSPLPPPHLPSHAPNSLALPHCFLFWEVGVPSTH